MIATALTILASYPGSTIHKQTQQPNWGLAVAYSGRSSASSKGGCRTFTSSPAPTTISRPLGSVAVRIECHYVPRSMQARAAAYILTRNVPIQYSPQFERGLESEPKKDISTHMLEN